MTAPLCVSCNGAGDKEPRGRPIRALLFDKYGLVRCLKRWPGFIEPAILDTAKWVTGKLEAKEEAARWHVGYRVRPMKWRNLEVQRRGLAGAETSSPLTPGGFEGLWSILESAKWSRWRTAEKDIIHSIQPGRTVGLRGVGGGGEDPHQPSCPLPNIKCHTPHQWMDNGYPSIFRTSLSRCPKPTTMSILRQFDPFSWLIHQPDLICKPPLFLKGRRVASAGTNGLKIDLFSPLKRESVFTAKEAETKMCKFRVKAQKSGMRLNAL